MLNILLPVNATVALQKLLPALLFSVAALVVPPLRTSGLVNALAVLNNCSVALDQTVKVLLVSPRLPETRPCRPKMPPGTVMLAIAESNCTPVICTWFDPAFVKLYALPEVLKVACVLVLLGSRQSSRPLPPTVRSFVAMTTAKFACENELFVDVFTIAPSPEGPEPAAVIGTCNRFTLFESSSAPPLATKMLARFVGEFAVVEPRRSVPWVMSILPYIFVRLPISAVVPLPIWLMKPPPDVPA